MSCLAMAKQCDRSGDKQAGRHHPKQTIEGVNNVSDNDNGNFFFFWFSTVIIIIVIEEGNGGNGGGR